MIKKIDIPKLRNRVMWTIVMSLISVLFVMSLQRKLDANVDQFVVIIKPIKGNRNLINESEVKHMVNKFTGFNVNNANIKDLDVRGIERIIKSDKRVKKAEVFVDGKDKLNVWIVQKQPIVRVMDSSNKSYYLDEEGERIPTVEKSAIRVPLATGNIDLYHEDLFRQNKCNKLNEVYAVSKYIFNDSLLSAMIEQIDVNENKDITLIPKIGRHEIIIGDSTYLQEKFDNLKVMYKDGLSREGWRKYSVLKLNYRGQVVGVRREEVIRN
jgi:cell division protein FtsQ